MTARAKETLGAVLLVLAATVIFLGVAWPLIPAARADTSRRTVMAGEVIVTAAGEAWIGETGAVEVR